MKETIETLRKEAENIRTVGANKTNVPSYILRLRNSVNELRVTESNKATQDYLTSLRDYRTFDQLPWTSKLFHHMTIFKVRPDYYHNWRGKGKYQYDLDSIVTKLDALLFRLNKKDL